MALSLQRYSTPEQVAELAKSSAENRCAEVIKSFDSLGMMMIGTELEGDIIGTIQAPEYATARFVGGLWRVTVVGHGSEVERAGPDAVILLQYTLSPNGTSGSGQLFEGTTITCAQGAVAPRKPLKKPVPVTVRAKR